MSEQAQPPKPPQTKRGLFERFLRTIHMWDDPPPPKPKVRVATLLLDNGTIYKFEALDERNSRLRDWYNSPDKLNGWIFAKIITSEKDAGYLWINTAHITGMWTTDEEIK